VAITLNTTLKNTLLDGLDTTFNSGTLTIYTAPLGLAVQATGTRQVAARVVDASGAAVVVQDGDSWATLVVQDGDSGAAVMVQDGDSGAAVVVQDGRGSVALIVEDVSILPGAE
jgi:hypothetical protein